MFSFNHRALLPVLFLLVSSACQRLEFDPNQSVNLHSAERVNLTAINQLRIQPNPDSIIRIGVIGDTHIDYENTEELVEALNAVPGLDLVVHTGDLTEHGVFQEFDWKVDYLSQLNMPYLAVVGNHDLVAKGKSVYQNMFGPTDFSFIFQRTKFIFFDSNSREYGFQENIPNLGWLERELQPSEDSLFSAVVLVAMCPTSILTLTRANAMPTHACSTKPIGEHPFWLRLTATCTMASK
jgi:putative phosphoesterase